MTIIDKFVLLVDEYKLLTNKETLSSNNYNINKLNYEELVFKIVLLRKFMMREEEIYIFNVLKELKEISDSNEIHKLNELEIEIEDLFKLDITYSLPNSKMQNLYHTITDLLYGLYLHSNTEKIENSILSDINLKKLLLRSFISNFEPIVYKTYETIKQNNKFVELEKPKLKKNAVIHFAAKKTIERNVIKSPQWSNINGKDIEQKDFNRFIKNLHKQDRSILNTVNEFIELLKVEIVNENKILRFLTIQSPIRQNINKNNDLFRKLNAIAYSTKVRYSLDLKYAYVYFFEDVEHGFSLHEKQLLQSVRCIRLKKAKLSNKFKIYDFVTHLPEYYTTIFKNEVL